MYKTKKEYLYLFHPETPTVYLFSVYVKYKTIISLLKLIFAMSNFQINGKIDKAQPTHRFAPFIL